MAGPETQRDRNKHGDSEGKERPENAFDHANFFSKLTFLWPFPLLKLGMTRPLCEDDLPALSQVDKSSHNRDYLEDLWKKEKTSNPRSPSLHRALLKDFLSSLWFIQPLMGVSAASRVVQAIALGLLVESFQTGKLGYVYGGILVLCAGIMSVTHHHIFFFGSRKAMQLRTACVANIHAKSLRMPSVQQDNTCSSGKVMNLASNDVERFIMCSLFMSYLFWSPIQSFAILGVGLWLLGPAFAAGFALLFVIVVPLQIYLANRFAFYRSKIAAITDRRVSLISQAIYGVRVMKMSGWEWQFLERITSIREEEISQIKKANSLKAMNEALFFSANIVISIVIFVVHVTIGGKLNPRSVFTVMGLVNLVQLEMTKHVSLGVMGLSECYVSISRIQAFLELSELPPITLENEDLVDDSPTLVLNDISCFWNYIKKDTNFNRIEKSQSPIPALSVVSLDFHRNSITCIIGSVGSGKSALLQALVGELPLFSGSLKRNYTSLAYAPQDTFIMNGSIRENIIMGIDWNEGFYEEIVKATGLVVDFQQLHNGDLTIVGDRGVQCSGGQRARIGLARAMYRNADVLVCDDPLSAVDANVGRLIFSEALVRMCVNRGKCVILATHQIQFVHDSRCVLMADGKIACIGSYNKCINKSGGRIIRDLSTNDNTYNDDSKGGKKMGDEEIMDAGMEGVNRSAEEDNQEMNVQGLVRFETFVKYSKAMGGCYWGVIGLALFAITQASSLITIALMGRWSERNPADQDSWDILSLVTGMGVLVVCLGAIRALVSFYLTVKASQRLHETMTKSVLRAKIEFFDTNPLGRILNRFSADIGSNDDLLPHTLFDFLMLLFLCLGSIITAVVVLPYTLIALPPLGWYFLRVRRFFITSTREMKRLEGLARSPIFAMLSESLSGVATIRTNESLQYFQKKFVAAHDSHSRAYFSFIAASRWVGFRMDAVAFLFLAVCTFLSVLLTQHGWIDVDPAILGLALTTLLQITGLFQYCIRQSAEVVNQMVSVERVMGFGNLPSEAEIELDFDKEISDWPRDGSIVVEDLSARYRATLPLSLENISLEIPSGSHVGVVGRTGSGKSTLMQCLFRLLEAENGSIKISGVDIKEIGLHKLRTSLSVIPQVPVLFSGCTIRENLDPFSKYTDESLSTVLHDVKMWDAIQELPKRWNTIVSEGGSNFSTGQRQLLCLARAILRKNRFLILDEPTANVDRHTDQLLQEALHKSFSSSTILSVAHRLDTVIESNYVLVLGNGKVLEYGEPAALLEKKDGYFFSMVRDTGGKSSKDLHRRAGEKISRKKL